MNDVDDADDLCRYQSEYLVWYRGASRRTVEDRVKDRRRECYDLLYMLRISSFNALEKPCTADR